MSSLAYVLPFNFPFVSQEEQLSLTRNQVFSCVRLRIAYSQISLALCWLPAVICQVGKAEMIRYRRFADTVHGL